MIDADEKTFVVGDRILCHKNHNTLGVLNGDLGTVVAVDSDSGTLAVRFDGGPETRELPGWYLHQGNVDYGYALTGHKAQGVTTGRSFTVIAGATHREWAYVAMSRGRDANTLYLPNPRPGDEQCTHLTHPNRRDALDALATSLTRSSTQTAAIDHLVGSSAGADIDTPGPPPPSSDVAERVAWIVAQRRRERDELKHRSPGTELATGR